MVDPQWVRERYAQIVKNKGDDETQHKLEDELYRDILQAILDEEIVGLYECICEALKTRELPFSRWYA